MADGVNIGTAWVTIAAESKNLKKDVEKEFGSAGEAGGKAFGKGLDKSSKDAGGALEFLEKNSTKMLLAATAAGGALFGLASAAGGLNAALQTSDRVFGDASDSVKAFAADTSDAVFLSESAALQAANSFGIFGSQAGMGADEAAAFSIRMVQMAADLAAVADVPVEQAIQDMRSAFAGSTETMQKYGINLNETELKAAYFAETGERITGVMTAQQKTMAVHWALLDKGAFAFGAAESEAGQMAAQMDRLKGTVGNLAADFGQPAVEFASGLLAATSRGLENLIGFNDATGGMLAAGLSAAGGISALGLAAGGVVGKVSKAVKGFNNLGTASKLAIGGLGGLALAVTAGFTVYGLMTQRSRELDAWTDEVAGSLSDASAEAWEYARAAAGASGEIDGFAVAQRALGLAVVASEGQGRKLRDAFGALGLQIDDTGKILLGLHDDTQRISMFEDMARGAGVADEYVGILAKTISETDDNGDALASTLASELYSALDITWSEARALATEMLPVASAMEEIDDQSEDLADRLPQIAGQFLKLAASGDEYANTLIEQAEAQAGTTRNAADAEKVYFALLEILGEMTPEQQAVAAAAVGLSDGLDDAKNSAKSFDYIAADLIDTTSDAAKEFEQAAGQASAFDTALRKLTDPAFRFEQAMLDQIDAADKLADRIAEAKEGTEGYGKTLDINTVAGRGNRRAIMDRAEAILEEVSAMKEQGYSLEEIEDRYIELREELVDQASEFTNTRHEAQQYVQQLDLVPSTIATAFEMIGQDEAHAEVDAIIEKLGGLPPEVLTWVQPLMDEGDYREVLRRLNALTVKTVSVGLKFVPGGAGGALGLAGAALRAVGLGSHGAYVPANSWQPWIVGEAGWDEAIIPIGNEAAMAAQLKEDARIREPIMRWAAKNMQPTLVGVDGGSSGITIDTINVGSRQDLPDVTAELDRQLFLARHGVV